MAERIAFDRSLYLAEAVEAAVAAYAEHARIELTTTDDGVVASVSPLGELDPGLIANAFANHVLHETIARRHQRPGRRGALWIDAATLPQLELAEESLGYFRWDRLPAHPAHHRRRRLTFPRRQPTFADLLAGPHHGRAPAFEELQRKGFLREVARPRRPRRALAERRPATCGAAPTCTSSI